MLAKTRRVASKFVKCLATPRITAHYTLAMPCAIAPASILEAVGSCDQTIKTNHNNTHKINKRHVENDKYNDDINMKHIYGLEPPFKLSLAPNTKKLLGEKSIFFLDAKQHSLMRKKLNPFFTLKSMPYRLDLINELTQRFINNLCTKTMKNGNDGVQLYTETKYFVFDAGIRSIFDTLLTQKQSETLHKHFETWYDGIMHENIDDLNNLDKAMAAKHEFERLIVDIWRNVMNEYDKDNLNKNSIIYELVHSGEINEDEIGEIILNIAFAAYDITTWNICNLIYNLYKYEDQRNVLKENIKDLDLNKFDDLMSNKYLDFFIKESMRIYPSASIMNKILKRDCMINNFVSVPFAAMNNDKNVFNGQRFVGNEAKRTGFFPFSMGVHKCLGQHLAVMGMKYMAAAMVRECDTIYIDEMHSNPSTVTITNKYVEIYGKFAHSNKIPQFVMNILSFLDP